MPDKVKTFKILLSGRVQGVGFRFFVEPRAKKYNIAGYVRNTFNNKVEVVCQGEKENLELFIKEIKKGPTFSIVRNVDIEEIKNPQNYSVFEIKF
jgi:acylphosphatase